MSITTIHKLAKDGKTCALCALELPAIPKEYVQPKPGEYVGAVITEIVQTAYRVGEHNQDALCNGTPASEFFQASVVKHE